MTPALSPPPPRQDPLHVVTAPKNSCHPHDNPALLFLHFTDEHGEVKGHEPDTRQSWDVNHGMGLRRTCCESTRHRGLRKSSLRNHRPGPTERTCAHSHNCQDISGTTKHLVNGSVSPESPGGHRAPPTPAPLHLHNPSLVNTMSVLKKVMNELIK